ncbi:UNVERIFIED_CONTAM: LINE-1 reverse transcriptase [Sesamum latifolium]|uniref:LINE-1 reverse transcriptase n=1 Tax=Sesamum latifolium TaxID=2727402 RepID=A0AAW2UUB1_9LAMI
MDAAGENGDPIAGDDGMVDKGGTIVMAETDSVAEESGGRARPVPVRWAKPRSDPNLPPAPAAVQLPLIHEETLGEAQTMQDPCMERTLPRQNSVDEVGVEQMETDGVAHDLDVGVSSTNRVVQFVATSLGSQDRRSRSWYPLRWGLRGATSRFAGRCDANTGTNDCCGSADPSGDADCRRILQGCWRWFAASRPPEWSRGRASEQVILCPCCNNGQNYSGLRVATNAPKFSLGEWSRDEQQSESFKYRLRAEPLLVNKMGSLMNLFHSTKRLLGGERTNRFIDLSFLRPWARYLLSEEDSTALIKPVTAAEVKMAFFDVAEDKSPGPDGYSFGFFKAAWPIVGEEVTQAILEFFLHGKLLKQVNATLLVLIPKVQAPSRVSDFRPISCCNVLYKVITKIIVQRLRPVLDNLISPSQNAFVPGRSIGDNILLAQELFTGYNQQHLPPRCALKVDLRKAYDTVEWDFMLATLNLFRFPPQFIRWIEECITSTSFSVCLNGTPHGFFAGAQGLRQGDPMSPYLFVLVMEVLESARPGLKGPSREI